MRITNFASITYLCVFFVIFVPFVGGQVDGIEFVFCDVDSRAADYVGDFASQATVRFLVRCMVQRDFDLRVEIVC